MTWYAAVHAGSWHWMGAPVWILHTRQRRRRRESGMSSSPVMGVMASTSPNRTSGTQMAHAVCAHSTAAPAAADPRRCTGFRAPPDPAHSTQGTSGVGNPTAHGSHRHDPRGMSATP